ncbi:muscle-specific protein 300 kDa-like isoform X2 [Epinephelus moara]|uniref:muscle-specific protein 300 kDa-like isoform X2 n=1 Tax=Epinephelus moara TaxID=300413 RepID=UPI00214F31BE|nr:muscle-specific protein 300 kDa-like isoform X2 [Epinephelus moara]
MAAALFRRGTGLCVRCIHRELCRVVWRPQTALFSSKPSDRKQPRRTHITRPAKASSMPTKPPVASSVKASTSKVPPLSKTEPAVSVFPAASSLKQVDADSLSNVTLPTTSGSSPTSTTPAPSEAAAIERKISAETIQTNIETAAVQKNTEPTATVEPLIETIIEPPIEPALSAVATLEVAAVAELPVEPTVDIPAEDLQTKGTDSGVVDVSHISKEEPLIETTVESPVEASHVPVETLETSAAVVESPVEPTIDVAVELASQKVETKSTDSGVADILHTATGETLVETAVEPSVEASTSPLETLESSAAVAEGSVETTIEAEAVTAAQAVQTNSTDSGVVNISYSAKEEASVETTIEPAAVSEATVEPTIETEAADSPSDSALIQNAQESAPLPLKNEPTIESSVESVNDTVEEGVDRSEEMNLESVTLHVDKVLVASLQTEELLQTKSLLDEKAEKELQELSVQTEIEHKAAAETESSSDDESESVTDVLSKWDSLSEDLQELEGQSGTLEKELLCHVPAVLSKTPGPSSASDPPVGAASLQMEETAAEAEEMTLESLTLEQVTAEVGGLETEVLLEMRDALEKDADARAKEEKMEDTATVEDVALLEDATEAEILTRLESISEATDALEAATSVMLEAMFGSEQGPSQPPVTLLADQKLEQQDEVIGLKAEKQLDKQEGSVLEAMSLESVTLAEVEASLGTLENESLSETADYLEQEAEIIAGEKRVEEEDMVASEETTETAKTESPSLPEGDVLSEDLQIDTLMEDLLFSVPGPVTGVTEGQIGQEVVRENMLDATVADGSVNVDTSAAVPDDFSASPALEEVLEGQEEVMVEEGAQTEALGNEDGTGTYAELDPVQRLFLEKIKEYTNMRRLNGGLLEAEPDYEKYLSEETAKLQRLYGGGDLSSFPQFTFNDPDMDQDSK